jgi:quinol monooxygenase YgiN
MSTITSILEFTFHPKRIDEAISLFEKVMPRVVEFDGCASAVVARDRDDPNTLFVIATWDSFERHEEYQEWRLADGRLPELEQLAMMLVRAPRDTVCDTVVSV